MTDDIQKLKAAFKQQPPISPRKAAKKVAIEQAMAAFDENNLRGHQGTGLGTRLMDTAKAVFETLIGRRPMRLNPALVGGASLSVMLVAAMSASYIQTRDWNDPFVTEQPVVPQTSKDQLAGSRLASQSAPKTKQEFEVAANKRERNDLARQPAPPQPKAESRSQFRSAAPVAGAPQALVAPSLNLAPTHKRMTRALPQMMDRRIIANPGRPAPGYYED